MKLEHIPHIGMRIREPYRYESIDNENLGKHYSLHAASVNRICLYCSLIESYDRQTCVGRDRAVNVVRRALSSRYATATASATSQHTHTTRFLAHARAQPHFTSTQCSAAVQSQRH